MAHPVYTVPAGDVLPIFFDTFDGGTGASITMTGLAVTDIEIYKDGGVTQRASDAGYTLLDTDGIDFDGLTGIHGFSINTGDNTDAGFYTVGAWFHVVVSAITVDAQTVNFVAAAFRIVPAETSAGAAQVEVTAAGLLAVADALLARDLGSGTNAGSLNERTVRSALRLLRNKVTVAAGTLTVTLENDSGSAWTGAVTTTAGANPITAVDPT